MAGTLLEDFSIERIFAGNSPGGITKGVYFLATRSLYLRVKKVIT